MITVSPLILGAIIVAKECTLWYYHRTMPPSMRFLSVFPGLVLGLFYVFIAVFGNQVPPTLQDAFEHWQLFGFFLWNGVVLYLTRDQHNQSATRRSWQDIIEKVGLDKDAS